jgi:hypothetical protein
MIGRRAVIGLSLCCALGFSAIAATGAMAETKTTTAFTCVPAEGGEGFSKEHCAGADAVKTGAKFKHEAIAVGKGTAFHATNEKTSSETTASTNAVITATVGGLKAVITAKKVTATGELENFEDPTTKAMDIKQRKVVIHFTEVVLSGALATVEGCKIENETIITNELTSTSLLNTMEAEYSGPGGVFWVIKLTGCKTKELNEKGLTATGTIKAITDGSTVETTTASTSGLRVLGQVATLTSKLTPRMFTDPKIENPISATTVVDP